MKKKNKTIRLIDKFNKFFNNPKPLFTVMIITLALMLIYIANLKQVGDLYVGMLENNNITISNVHYFTTEKTNYFYATPAYVSNKDNVKLYKYRIGYYTKDLKGNVYTLVERSGEIESGVLLDEVVTDMSSFNFGELTSQHVHFNSDVMKNLDRLYFIVSGTTSEDETSEKTILDYELKVTNMAK